MNGATRDLCYQHYRNENDPGHRIQFLDILVGMLKAEREELERMQAGVSVPATKRGNK